MFPLFFADFSTYFCKGRMSPKSFPYEFSLSWPPVLEKLQAGFLSYLMCFRTIFRTQFRGQIPLTPFCKGLNPHYEGPFWGTDITVPWDRCGTPISGSQVLSGGRCRQGWQDGQGEGTGGRVGVEWGSVGTKPRVGKPRAGKLRVGQPGPPKPLSEPTRVLPTRGLVPNTMSR